jgi:predicted ATPase
VDAFGRTYEIPAQRLRYELKLGLSDGDDNSPRGIFVRNEFCRALAKNEDTATYLRHRRISYNARVNPFIKLNESEDAIQVRQDGRQKHGRPMLFSLREASRTALSTISTAEFPHLYALRNLLAKINFLEINPTAARGANDRFETQILKSDASNLSAVLSRLRDETRSDVRPSGILSDISSDLTALIPSVSTVEVRTDVQQKQYTFSVGFSDNLYFSSRVISDGTLRLLALLTALNDPSRGGTLCFEEPENGVHEGRIPLLVEFLRDSVLISEDDEYPLFQIIINTHSPKVMAALRDNEIVAADTVTTVSSEMKLRVTRTRMRTGVVPSSDLFDPEKHLVRSEVETLLQRPGHAV